MTALKSLLFTIFVPGFFTAYVPYLLISRGLGLHLFEIGAVKFFGIVLIITGVVFYLFCVWDFTFFGKGTPAPIDPPKIFVARRLYKFVRNPMYVGVLALLSGEGILFESLTLFIYAFIMWMIFNTFVILYEEPTLKKKLGKTYEEYLKTVPRWLLRYNS